MTRRNRRAQPDLEKLPAVVVAAKAELPAAPPPSDERAHLAAVFAAARPAAAVPEPTLPLVPARRTRPSRIAARAAVVAVSAAILAALGGAAYAGALPTGVQRHVARLVREVGIRIPPGADHKPQQGGRQPVDSLPATGEGQSNGPGSGSTDQGGNQAGQNAATTGDEGAQDAPGQGTNGGAQQQNRNQGNGPSSDGPGDHGNQAPTTQTTSGGAQQHQTTSPNTDSGSTTPADAQTQNDNRHQGNGSGQGTGSGQGDPNG